VIAMSYGPLRRVAETWDTALLRFFANLRTAWLTDPALVVNALVSVDDGCDERRRHAGGFRRWRHLLVFLGAVVGVEIVAYQLSLMIELAELRRRIVTDWSGFAMPSRPVVSVAIADPDRLLIVPRRARYVAKWAIAGCSAAVARACTWVWIDRRACCSNRARRGAPGSPPSAGSPNDAFPVSYRREASAPGRRRPTRRGHRPATRGRLGLEVVEIAGRARGLRQLDTAPRGSRL
jgi:hypothetical protein